MNEKDLILPMSRIPSVGEFLGILHIKPAGFAAELFTNIYNDLFVWSTDLRSEYERYYCVEYPTFVNYLELAHEIYLEPTDLEKSHVLKIEYLGGLLEEAYDDNVLDTVITCIRKLEESHES
jgi:hypothetical protein